MNENQINVDSVITEFLFSANELCKMLRIQVAKAQQLEKENNLLKEELSKKMKE